MVLLPGNRPDGAEVVAERVRADVAALGLRHPTNAGGVVTVTIGVNEASGFTRNPRRSSTR